jgi:hypothetical protein
MSPQELTSYRTERALRRSGSLVHTMGKGLFSNQKKMGYDDILIHSIVSVLITDGIKLNFQSGTSMTSRGTKMPSPALFFLENTRI